MTGNMLNRCMNSARSKSRNMSSGQKRETCSGLKNRDAALIDNIQKDKKNKISEDMYIYSITNKVFIVLFLNLIW